MAKRSGYGHPAVGDVVADGDDVEDAEFALHGGCAGEVGDHLAGGEVCGGGIVGLEFFSVYFHIHEWNGLDSWHSYRAQHLYTW